MTPLEKIGAVRAALPAEGLFAEKDWLLSPNAFPLDAKFVEDLEKLGYRLSLFQRACNLLYHLSVSGKQPAWIADYLDRGKPIELVEYARQKKFRDDLPCVIRPDLVLTETGFTIAELDTVPGGIGLTAWLNQTYAALGEDVIGGARGMIDGFGALVGDGDVVISKEAATYQPEMEWLCKELRNAECGLPNNEEKWRVVSAEHSSFPQSAEAAEGTRGGWQTGEPLRTPHSIYRFFELFDLPNLPSARMLMESALAGEVRVTPPFKPYLEEKMWFALFWLRPLRDFWRRELSERHFLKLQESIPYTWIVDPTPLPQHAVIPELGINDWRELGNFSQKQRELILKISGFSELAWGSRGVSLAADMPHREWQDALENALREFDSHPYILQRFHKGRLVEHPYFDREENALRSMHGRVRLCPYFFIRDGKAELRGALATICPADKKLLHGMRDAILVPGAIAPE